MLSTDVTKQFLSRVFAILTDGLQVHTLVCEDFNYDSAIHDRIDCHFGRFCGELGPEQRHFDDLFKDYAEFDTLDFTHRNCRRDTITSFSRLDRAYTSLHPTLCHDMLFPAALLESIKSPRFDFSDHVPLRISIRAAAPPRRRTIPSWVTRHPLWPSILADVLVSFCDAGQSDPNSR
jgi:hypothetical protein